MDSRISLENHRMDVGGDIAESMSAVAIPDFIKSVLVTLSESDPSCRILVKHNSGAVHESHVDIFDVPFVLSGKNSAGVNILQEYFSQVRKFSDMPRSEVR